MATLRMMVYRQAPAADTWTISATVRGPFGPVPMAGNVLAWDEGGAVLAFLERVQGEGFELVGEVKASRLSSAVAHMGASQV